MNDNQSVFVLSVRSDKNDQKPNEKILQDPKSIDFVLAYNANDTLESERQVFERNLLSEGLLLDRDESQDISFLKIHATHEVLCRYAEILKFKFPTKLEVDGENSSDKTDKKGVPSIFEPLYKRIRLDAKIFPPRKYELYHEFSRDKSYLFDVNDPTFFPCYVRLAVVNFILERTAFAACVEDNQNCIGIDKLLADRAYISAYPLHDGHHLDTDSQRSILFNEWALLKNWIKHQPLDAIKNYFGVKIALYFGWLGFYTNMLIFPAILGVICFFYGLVTMFHNETVNAICNVNDSVVLCPKCDKCPFTPLSDTCVYSRISHILDNNVMVFFAVCMSLWATIYLELWKRYSAKMIHRWGMSDFSCETEPPRPAYLAQLMRKTNVKQKLNPITRLPEPELSWKSKLPSYFISYSVIFLFIFISVTAVMALIVYRMSTLSSKNIYEGINPVSYKYLILLPVTTGVINLIVITILNYLYDHFAVFLTNLEYQRTQTEYDNSLSLKIYLFEFVNYYSSLFYIAFLKGKSPGSPAKYYRIFGLRQEECLPSGCLMELFIQLSIIMIGKQILNEVFEMAQPYLMKIYRNFKYGNGANNGATEIELKLRNRMMDDFKLMQWNSMGLFYEYLEMVLQFGFCTLFVIAFPLAPLAALINNIFEVRLDARKFLTLYQRPSPRRVSDIGIWLKIMSVVGRISVFTTAFIIAFSSNFIPRIVHSWSDDLQNIDYLEFVLSYFHVNDFEEDSKPDSSKHEICRYPEFRYPPNHQFAYKRNRNHFRVLAWRFAFIIIFQNIVACLQQAIDWAFPDVPAELNKEIKREVYHVSKRIISEEKKKARRRMGEGVHIKDGDNVEPES